MKLFVNDKTFYRKVVNLAVPVVLQGMLTIGVNMIDTIMLGAYGEYQLAGSSLANEFINIFQIMSMGMGYGAAVLTAQYWGGQNIEKLKKTVTVMLRLCLAVSAIFSMITFLFPAQLMEIFTDDYQIVDKGILYFRVSAFAYIPTGISLTLTAVLRSVQEVRLPFITSVIVFFVNIFLNWVFIFGNLGAPELQITGAALGTLLSRIVEVGIIGGFFFFKDSKIGYRMRDLKMRCQDILHLYISYCVPVLISDTLLGLGNSVVSIVMGHIGASFVAANAIVSQVTRMSTILTQGVSSSSGVITGNSLGAGEKKKAYEQGKTFWALSIGLGIFAGITIILLCPVIINSFQLEEETVKIARELMYAVAIMVVFQSVQSVLTKGVLRGGGDTRFLMYADILFLWLGSIPLGILLGLVWHAPAFLIYVALKADWMIKSVWCSLRMIKGKWIDHCVYADGAVKSNGG